MSESGAAEAADAAEPVAGPPAAAVIAVESLMAHPGNVREDLDLTDEFCASIAETGVRVPLLVTPEGAGFRVIEGHRRLAAAVKAGQAGVPCVLDPGRAGDEAGQFLDMAVANGAGYRKNFTVLQEAQALFAAHQAGANKTRIRKATGRSPAEVRTALAAGGLPAGVREQAAGLPRQASLADLALLAEFEGDDDATSRLLSAMRYGHAVEYTAERIRRERAEEAEHAQVLADLDAGGYQVSDDLPEGAWLLAALTQDGVKLTAETHGQCPGRGVFFRPWQPHTPTHYCTDPTAYGHELLFAPGQPVPPPGDADACQDGLAGVLPGGAPEPEPEPDPVVERERRLVIEGNEAWEAAARVRHRWHGELLARRSAPREVSQFLAIQFLTVPEPVRAALQHAPASELFRQITGRDAAGLETACAGWAVGRLPLAMLAPVMTAYELQISGPGDERRATWRPERYSHCPTAQAGTYLAFLASLGYGLSPIERSVADGTPYTGDNPPEPLPDPATGDSGSATPADPPSDSSADAEAA